MIDKKILQNKLESAAELEWVWSEEQELFLSSLEKEPIFNLLRYSRSLALSTNDSLRISGQAAWCSEMAVRTEEFRWVCWTAMYAVEANPGLSLQAVWHSNH